MTLASCLKMFSGSRPAASTRDDHTDGSTGEEELRLYRQALAQSGDAVVITNAMGVIEYANTAFGKTTGYAVAEAIGRRPSFLKSGEHGASFYARLWATLKRGHSFRGVFINRHRDGYLYHEEKTISPITDRMGAVI